MTRWRETVGLLLSLAGVAVLAACAARIATFDGMVQVYSWSHREISDVTWSADGARVAVSDAGGVWLYDVSGRTIRRKKLAGRGDKATTVAFNATGDQIAVGLADGRIELWSVAGGERVAQFAAHKTPVLSLAFSPDGDLLASGAGEWFADFVPRAEGVEVRLWDAASGDLLAVLSQELTVPPVSDLIFSLDGAVLAVGQQGHGCASPRCASGQIRLWELQTGAISEMRVGHDIVFSGDGRLAAALGAILVGGKTQVWEVGTGSAVASPTAIPDGFAFDLALSRDGSTAAVVVGEYGFGGQKVHLWRVDSGAEVASAAAGDPIALSSDGRLLVSARGADHRSSRNARAGQADHWLRLWDIEHDSEPTRLLKLNHVVTQLSFSPDNLWLAAVETGVMTSRLYLVAVPGTE